jgi:iron-sulfur cluster repair protein YtfE (RIC family)
MAVERGTSTVTINAAFLQEIKQVNADLWKLLSEVQRVCGNSQRIRERRRHVVELLAELRDQLAMHFALEEAFGYFDDPLRVAPRLSATASQLRDEHKTLYAEISHLTDEVDAVERAGDLPTRARWVVEQFRTYYDLLQHHESRENELILDAYDEDIGVGD